MELTIKAQRMKKNGDERLVGSNWPLLQVLLSELTKLEFELFW
jgi:hypothetical protein